MRMLHTPVAPKKDGQCLHQLRVSNRIVATMVYVAKAVPVFSFFRHTSSEPAIVLDQLCELLDGPPVEIDSALWGWISRKRHYWLAGPTGGLQQVLPRLPTGFTMGIN